MHFRASLFFLVIMIGSGLGAAQQGEDPSRKLGAFLGKWATEGSFTGSDNKITATLECRWSPHGIFLACDQLVKLPNGEHHQFTAYSYSARDGYSYVTISDPGAKPSFGKLEIQGNVWTYSSSFENNGKTTQIRTTNEFTDPRTEVFKTQTSEDGGATWKTMLQGVAHKVGD